MAFECLVGSDTLNTSTGNQTITTTGVTPKIVWIRSTASTADGTIQDDLFFSLGWGDLTTEFSVQAFSEDALAASNVIRSIQNSIFTRFDNLGAKTEEFTLVSFNSGNFVINVDVAGAAIKFEWMVWGGSDLTNVYVGNLMASALESGDTASITSSSAASPTSILTSANHLAQTGNEVTISGHSGSDNDAAVNATHIVTRVDATHFTIPVDLTGGGGTGGTATWTGIMQPKDVPFQPDAVFFMTSQNSNGAGVPDRIDANTNREWALAVGFMEGISGTQSSGFFGGGEENVATSNAHSVVGGTTKAWSNAAWKDPSWALDGEFRYESMEPDGFRVLTTTVAAVSHYIGFLAVKGSNWEVVERAAPSVDNTKQAVTNTAGFVPSGAIFTQSIGGINVAALSHGWASNDGTSSPTPEGATLITDDDNVGTTNTKRLTTLTKALAFAFAAATSTYYEADVDTWNPSGLTALFTKANSGDLPYHIIMFGSGTDTSTPGGEIAITAKGNVGLGSANAMVL